MRRSRRADATQGTLIEAVRKVGGEDIPGTDGRVDLCPQNGSVLGMSPTSSHRQSDSMIGQRDAIVFTIVC